MSQRSCTTCSSPRTIKARTKAKYDDQWREQGERAAAERRRNLSMVTDPLLSMVHPLTDKVVVDLGIGTGCLAFRALELSPPRLLIGVDFSSVGLCVASAISKHQKFQAYDCEMVQADLERLPISTRSVDVVLSQATFNLLPDKSAALREIARICRHGAKIAISDAFRTSNPREGESWEQCIAGAVTVAEFSQLCLGAGLFIAGQVDLTQQVRMLVASRKWDWPEFIESNMDYRAFLLTRS
ncbi:MAG: class I SAM-dependent methyltransferase [Thermoplasmata archaeon]